MHYMMQYSTAEVRIPDCGLAPFADSYAESCWNDGTVAQVGALALVRLINERIAALLVYTR